MSLQQRAIEPVPAETVTVAKAAFPKGNRICNCATNGARSTTMRGLRTYMAVV